MDCSKLTTTITAAQCGQLASAGAEDDVILVNFDDVDKANSTIANNVLENIALKNGKQAYSFSTFGKSMNDTGEDFTLGTYRNTWLHKLFLRIFVKTQTVKNFVDEFAAGARVMAIVKNKEGGTTGNVKYEMYGWDNGLILKTSSNTLAMADGVVYSLELGSEDAAQEGSLPKSVFDTDLATTEAMLESLTSVVP